MKIGVHTSGFTTLETIEAWVPAFAGTSGLGDRGRTLTPGDANEVWGPRPYRAYESKSFVVATRGLQTSMRVSDRTCATIEHADNADFL